MTIAVAVAVAIMAVAAAVYLSMSSKESVGRFNGAALVAAARAYTRDLQGRKQPVPDSVSLEELVALHFLQPADIEAFRGMKATILLKAEQSGPNYVLMKVRMPDGTDIELLGDGSVREAAP